MGSAFESVLTFLFKYPARVFERGELVFAPVLPVALIIGVGIAGLALIVAMYWRVRGVSVASKALLGVFRALCLVLVLGCLLRPTIVLSSAVAQRNVLAVVLDDSRSMRLKDVNNAARLTALQQSFSDSSPIMRKLSEKFALRVFRFSADASPATNAGTLTGNGTRSDLATALNVTREDLAGMPLAGIVMVTDGADNGGTDLAASLLGLRARRVPVYTVGVGQERFARDIAIERVTAPPSVLAGSTLLIESAIGVRGVKGERTSVTVEANGRIVATEEVALAGNGDITRARLRVPPMPPGTYRLTVRARPIADETVTENNAYHTVVEVRPGPERILYMEGEPRPEFAFLRRAVAADSAIQVVGLLRSADKKYLRLGVRDSLELVSGFPTKREELFKYRGIILGSIESSFFSGEQMRMIADFVSQRGGGLLALGGRAALAEGGYTGTPIAEVLPFALDQAASDTGAAPREFSVHPTNAGLSHAGLQLRATDAASAARWDSLPPLTSVNHLGTLRSGATVLLTGRDAANNTGTRNDMPLFAFQHYGRGVGAVFGVQDSWLWRMHASIGVDDPTHLTLWRQTLRWLVEGVPEQLDIAAVPSRVGPGEPVTLRAHVTDSAFRDVNSASVVAKITAPSGRTTEVPMEWSLREDGTYTGRFTTEEAGVYSMVAESRQGRDTSRSAATALLADDQGADVEQAELRTPLLRRISQETGGRYYPLSEANKLTDDVIYTESGVTVRESKDLWDMPIIFLLLASFLAAEWIFRRRRGLA